MSYCVNSLYPRHNLFDLPKQHISMDKWQKNQVDILTIGDSFSNGGGNGKNVYYQDYIASINNLEVLNIQQLPNTLNYMETIVALNNSGVLDKMNLKYIIIESVEREAINRFNAEIDFNINISSKYIYEFFKESTHNFHGEPANKTDSFITNLNINALKYNILYNFKEDAHSSQCIIQPINKVMFSAKNNKTLLSYRDDHRNIRFTSKESILLLNNNLNKLAKILKEKGIILYFMPAVDKYNLYSEYIINNKYPKSNFFEYLRVLPKEYSFIDTKKILSKELQNGVLDLYYSDDTHWSYKASKSIFEKERFE